MGSHNPFLGAAPMYPTSQGGAVPSGGDDDGATAIIGGSVGPGVVSTKSTPATLGALVLLAAGVIVIIHIAGVRTHFTVSAGK